MPADRKQVEGLKADASLVARWLLDHGAGGPVFEAQGRLLDALDAFLARAEAAETNFKAALFLLPDADILRLKADGLVGGMKARILSEAREIDALRAAHQPLAPVKEGGAHD